MSCEKEMSVWSMEMSAPQESDPKKVFAMGLLQQCSAHDQMVKSLTKVKIEPGSSVM